MPDLLPVGYTNQLPLLLRTSREDCRQYRTTGMAEPLNLGAMVARISDSENRMGKLLRENGQGGI